MARSQPKTPKRTPLLATTTNEPFQPVRLYFAVPDAGAVRAKPKRIACVQEGPAMDCWEWLFAKGAAGLRFPGTCQDVPEAMRPIILGRIRFPRATAMTLQTNSFPRALEGARFFGARLGKLAVALRVRVINRCFAADEGDIQNLASMLDRDVVVVDPREAELVDLLALERRKVAWARDHLPRGADSQVGRVVDRFALGALAGELASEWGVVPWRPGNAEWAADVCLRAWLVQRGGIGAGEHERGVAAVLGFIARNGSSRFADWDNQGERVANCAGFRRRDGQERMDYLFHSEGWKDACEGFGSRDVAKACAAAGLLEAVTESGVLRFQKNVKVPGRGTERFYIVTGRGLDAFRQRQAETAEGESW